MLLICNYKLYQAPNTKNSKKIQVEGERLNCGVCCEWSSTILLY
jgi:hypothetical protein